MHIGIFSGDLEGPRATVDAAVENAKRAADDGFASFWLPQIFGLDALTTLAVIGGQVPDLALGTAVVPIYPRHPAALAQQALTVQSASQSRLTLGIGLSHQMVIEHMYGYSFERPASFMEEYLTALGPLLRGEQADADTDRIRTHLRLDVADAAAPGLLVAALGPRMLRAAAELADGTVTWMTGPTTLAEHTIPTLRAAAGGQDKRVVAALPVAVTDDLAGARARAAKAFEVYGILPSYRAMLDREGAAGPEDVALIGDAATVTDAIKGMVDSGVTEFVAVEFSGGDDARRTRDALASLL